MIWLIPIVSFILVIVFLISLLAKKRPKEKDWIEDMDENYSVPGEEQRGESQRKVEAIGGDGRNKSHAGKAKADGSASPKKFCILCATPLEPGQSLKTKVIEIAGGKSQGGRVVERRAEIRGCPHCWPHNAQHPRRCPVCTATLREGELVFALYYEKEHKRNHLHVLGCSQCRAKPTFL